MSFDNNPYKNLHVHLEEKATLHCDSCGWDSIRIDVDLPFIVIINMWRTHIRVSHRLTQADVERWADY